LIFEWSGGRPRTSFACDHAERTGGDAHPSTIEIEFHFLKAYFYDRQRQDRLLRLRMTQTITSTPICAYKRSKRSGLALQE